MPLPSRDFPDASTLAKGLETVRSLFVIFNVFIRQALHYRLQIYKFHRYPGIKDSALTLWKGKEFTLKTFDYCRHIHCMDSEIINGTKR